MKISTYAVTFTIITSLVPSAYADDAKWFSFTYSDLQPLQLSQPTYKEIWLDRIATNNQFYKAQHDIRFAFGNAPATEAHFFVEAKSQSRLLVVSVLNTVQACKILFQDFKTKTTLKTCPVRLLLQDHNRRQLQDAGEACLVEYGSATNATPKDFTANAMYVNFDVASNAIKLDSRFGGQLKDQCAISITLPDWP